MKAKITDINTDYCTMSIPPELAARLSLREGQEVDIRLESETLFIELPEESVRDYSWLRYRLPFSS